MLDATLLLRERISIVQRVIALFGVDKIAGLLADREFLGDDWLAWLQKSAIGWLCREWFRRR